MNKARKFNRINLSKNSMDYSIGFFFVYIANLYYNNSKEKALAYGNEKIFII